MKAAHELTRLAGVLSVDADRLAGLEALSGHELAALSAAVSDALHADDATRLQPLLALLGRVPAGLAAGVVERALSPRFVARVAAHLGDGAASDILERLSSDYLAEVAVWLEHDRCGWLLASIPPARIADIARRLAARERWSTMAAVTAHLPDRSLEAALAALEQRAIAKTIAIADAPTRRRALAAST